MKYTSQLIITPLLLLPSLIFSQNLTKPPHPVFTPFVGTVYKMPKVKRKIGDKTYISLQERYGENIYNYEKIGKIGLKQLNIPETAINERNFPGVQQKIKFAMILDAEVEIPLTACYEFSLSSDDGSILWIDSTLIIDNDGGHQMRMKQDSIVLTAGNYPVKVWYFQGMPDRYGLILDAKIIGKPAVCPIKPEKKKKKIVNIQKDKTPTTPEKITLESSILFETGKFELKAAAIADIHKVAQNIAQSEPTNITVIGHTDNVGNLEANQLLSLKRAQVVAKELEKRIDNPAIKILPIGKGETSPIADNSTTEGKAKNRRVEFLFQKLE